MFKSSALNLEDNSHLDDKSIVIVTFKAFRLGGRSLSHHSHALTIKVQHKLIISLLRGKQAWCSVTSQTFCEIRKFDD